MFVLVKVLKLSFLCLEIISNIIILIGERRGDTYRLLRLSVKCQSLREKIILRKNMRKLGQIIESIREKGDGEEIEVFI